MAKIRSDIRYYTFTVPLALLYVATWLYITYSEPSQEEPSQELLSQVRSKETRGTA